MLSKMPWAFGDSLSRVLRRQQFCFSKTKFEWNPTDIPVNTEVLFVSLRCNESRDYL